MDRLTLPPSPYVASSHLRSWGTIGYDQDARGTSVVLAPPSVPVRRTASRTREVPARLAGGTVGCAVALSIVGIFGVGWWLSIWIVVLISWGASAATAALARASNPCVSVTPVPWSTCELACAIEHASAVARGHHGDPDYDDDVRRGIREILWSALAADPSLSSAGLPLARVFSAVQNRNRTVFGPHADPSWYPAVSTDPARWPLADRRATEIADRLVVALEAEADLGSG